jgi:TRAP-type mannitol/chloroaromatic compound transport system substrate-binding protein
MSTTIPSRRAFLTGAASGAAAAASSLPAPAISQGRVSWKMVTTWPKNFPGLGTGAQRICDRIKALTDGRMEVRLYAARELVPAFEAFDAVREGIAEMSHDASYYWVAKHKSAPFFCTVPGGLTAQEHMAWIYFGGGQALWDELYGEFGLRAFLAGGSGVQMGGWFQKEIRSLDDFKGLKMRIPGLGAEVINRLGATAVNLPGGEIMPALQSGVIDATEWVGPWNDLAFGFYKIAKYYYGPGFHEPSSALEVVVSRDKFDALPKDLQAAVENACMAENGYMLSEFTAGNNEAQRVLVQEHNVKIGNFPDDVVKAAFDTSIDVVRETANEGDLAKRIFENWWRFRQDAVARAPYAEQGYMNNRSHGAV